MKIMYFASLKSNAIFSELVCREIFWTFRIEFTIHVKVVSNSRFGGENLGQGWKKSISI